MVVETDVRGRRTDARQSHKHPVVLVQRVPFGSDVNVGHADENVLVIQQGGTIDDGYTESRARPAGLNRFEGASFYSFHQIAASTADTYREEEQ